MEPSDPPGVFVVSPFELKRQDSTHFADGRPADPFTFFNGVKQGARAQAEPEFERPQNDQREQRRYDERADGRGGERPKL
jgi:hypothetical protein